MIEKDKVKKDSKTNSVCLEFKVLTKLESPYLIKLIQDDFLFNDFYCFLTEYCEVNK